jgi:ketosteroid isomerase-like protein
MSEENVEIVRRAFEAFNRGDLDAAGADASPDMEYVAPGALPGRQSVGVKEPTQATSQVARLSLRCSSGCGTSRRV